MNIKYDKILDALREADTVSVSTGTKYHLFNGDSITVSNGFEYFIACEFILAAGSSFEIESGGRLVLHDGLLLNSGVLTNSGIIKNGL